MPKDKKEKVFIIFCIFCIACGVVLRFVNIGLPFIDDEIFTVVTSDRAFSLSYIIKEFFIPDVHPPLYNIIMHFWSVIVPTFSEAVIRIPSMVFAFAALFCGWFYYPRNRDLTEKYIFTAFMSVSALTILTSAAARSYSLLLLLSVLLTFLTFNMADKISKDITPSKKDFAAYFILTLLAGYTHYVGAIAAGAQTLVLLGCAFYKKRGFWRIAALYFTVVVLMTPWIFVQMSHNAGNINGLWWNTVQTYWMRSVGSVIDAFTTGELAGLLIWLSVLYALFFIVRKDKNALKDVFILFPVLTFLVAVGVMLLMLTKINLFISRLFMPLFPPAFIIFAFFMNYAAKKRKIFMLVNAVALSAALYTSASSVYGWHKYDGRSKNIVSFLLKNYPQTRNELFYTSDNSYKKALPLIKAYYFRALAGKPPAETYNIISPEGIAAFKAARGVVPLWTSCAYMDSSPKKIAAKYGSFCVIVYDK